MRKKRYVWTDSKPMISHLSKDDCGVNHVRMMKININELKKLAKLLELRIPKGMEKSELQKQIIPFCISNSSDWKKWSRTCKKLINKPMSQNKEAKAHWSPPKVGPALQPPEKHPEKGVQVWQLKKPILMLKMLLLN